MSALSSLMDLYGIVDQAAIRSDEPGIRAAVKQLFPPVGGQEVGWYEELQNFFERTSEPAMAFQTVGPPDLPDVLGEVIEQGEQFTIPELSRLVYGVGALTQVLSPAQLRESREPLAVTLAFAAPPDSPQDMRFSNAEQLLDLLSNTYVDRRSWRPVTRTAVARGWLNPDVADMPLCSPSVVCIDGKACLVVDTVFASKAVSLDQVKDVVDPLNWALDYPHFWCAMNPVVGTSDGWSRVLEKVGFCPPTVLRTALKYYKTTADGLTQARVDYDLDQDNADLGDGLTTVDRGYINLVVCPAIKWL